MSEIDWSKTDWTPESVRGYWMWLKHTTRGSLIDAEHCLCHTFFVNPIPGDPDFKLAKAAVALITEPLEKAGYVRDQTWALRWSEGIDK